MVSFGVDKLRLIDANANRAREGIRTAEDYTRFTVGDVNWAGRLKRIRGAITELLSAHLKIEELIGSRNVGQDPLRPAETPGASRASAESSKAVAHRGLKRAQEALRVLEENLGGQLPHVSAEFARRRYELYVAEQWLVNASDAARVLSAATVYVLLTESLCSKGLLQTAEAVLKGGARLIQLREKEEEPDKVLLAKAQKLRQLCESHNAMLICNDRLDMALAAGAAGVHLGQDDFSPDEVRKVGGSKLLVGRSTHSVEQARYTVEVENADYIAIGAIYETSTKQGRILAGVELAERVCGLGLSVPVFAIGGITVQRTPELKKAGVRRVAISSAIIAAADPESETRKLIEAMAE